MLSAELGKDLISLAEDALGEKIEPYILSDSLEELKAISRHKGKRASFAKVALKLAEKMNVLKLDLERDLEVDEKLLETSRICGLVLATIDSKLMKRAREIGIPTLSVGKGLKIRLEGIVP
ncbi:MAG: hypothetical protein DRN68_02100 [Thaumarchaeota archaeon]|nr:MAG: hypothetical protein DRN68_02100 [Nitrososphaerota archaeon]